MNISINSSTIWGLEELSSRDEQCRLWLSDGNTGEVSSLTEAISGVFDVTLVKLLRSKDFPDKLRKQFCSLEQLLSNIDESDPPIAIIDSDVMAKVRLIASQILEELRP